MAGDQEGGLLRSIRKRRLFARYLWDRGDGQGAIEEAKAAREILSEHPDVWAFIEWGRHKGALEQAPRGSYEAARALEEFEDFKDRFEDEYGRRKAEWLTAEQKRGR